MASRASKAFQIVTTCWVTGPKSTGSERGRSLRAGPSHGGGQTDTCWSVTCCGNRATIPPRRCQNVRISRHKKRKNPCFPRVSSEAVFTLSNGGDLSGSRSVIHACMHQTITYGASTTNQALLSASGIERRQRQKRSRCHGDCGAVGKTQ